MCIRDRPARALVQLSRRHARPRVACAERLHGIADAVPVERPYRTHGALLAVPRPALPDRQERAAAGEVAADVHGRVRATLRAEGDRRVAWAARAVISSRWSTRR